MTNTLENKTAGILVPVGTAGNLNNPEYLKTVNMLVDTYINENNKLRAKPLQK